MLYRCQHIARAARAFRALAPCALALLLGPAASAQPAFQVADLNTSREAYSFAAFLSGPFGSLDGTLYFASDDGVHGIELWKTDGTAAGASVVRDICPGACSSLPQGMRQLGGRLLFFADDGAHGRELWSTDGTAEGTFLVRDIRPGLARSVGMPWILPSGGVAFLSADDGVHGAELWVTDGTEGGTLLMADLNPGPAGSDPEPTLNWAGFTVLTADDGSHGREPWLTDGTLSGTHLLKDVNPGPAGSIQPSSPWNILRPWLATSWGRLLFVADDGVHGQELWASDGTADGTVLLRDSIPGASGGSPSFLTEWAGSAYFSGSDEATGRELWQTDGTPEGTALVADVNPGPENSSPQNLTAVGDLLFFQAYDATHGYELRASDGSAAGTALVEDIRPGTDSSWSPYLPVQELNGRLLFFALGANGIEVWTSDGTETGTSQVSNMSPGATPAWYRPYLQPIGNQVYFFADATAGGTDLWATDGLPGGTRRVVDPHTQTSAFFPAPFDGSPVGQEAWTTVGGRLFFPADDGITGYNPWVTDGTTAGTVQLADVVPDDPDRDSIQEAIELDTGRALFSTGSLWETDGAPAGTAPLFATGGPSDIWQPMARLGKSIFFTGSTTETGQELWSTDGTAAGTVLVKDIRPAGASSSPQQLTVAGGTLFFTASTDPVSNDHELWKSDGTEAGTVRVRDVQPGTVSSSPDHLTPFGGRLFFTADDGAHGRELWVSDGTEAGTVLAADLLPGAGSGLPRDLAAVGNAVIFSATDGVHGVEPWAGDGTWARRLADIAPNALPSSPAGFFPLGPHVYFAATDASTGFELWAIPRAALKGPLDFYTLPPCRLTDTRPASALATGERRTVSATGTCGIPPEARAIAANLTVVAPNGPGYLVAWPAGNPLPETANLTYSAGELRSAHSIVELSDNGKIDLQGQTLATGGQVHVVVDVTGYFR